MIVASTKSIRTIKTGQVYDVLVSYDGVNLIVLLDGQPLMSVPAVGVPSGTAGFRAKATTGKFGYIAVK